MLARWEPEGVLIATPAGLCITDVVLLAEGEWGRRASDARKKHLGVALGTNIHRAPTTERAPHEDAIFNDNVSVLRRTGYLQ